MFRNLTDPNQDDTFLICFAVLVGAYFIYGRYLERTIGADPDREPPCRSRYDGVDYLPLPKWKTFLIQLLNIAGLGPIFARCSVRCTDR